MLMEIETSGAIKLFFPNPSLMLVYFEAIHNSLDANASEINIEIDVQAFDKPDTLVVEISDNGDGFTEENFSRFRTLLKPRDRFHKGIGRLVFLNYFNKIKIESIWGDKVRSFVFTEGFNGDAPIEKTVDNNTRITTLRFSGFKKGKVKSYDYLRPSEIKKQVIDQFLPTFQEWKRNGRKFRICISLNVSDGNSQREFFSDKVEITENDLPEMKAVEIFDEKVDGLSKITMHYCIDRISGSGRQFTAFNIDGRTIEAKLLSKSSIPPGYACIFFFESEIFHAHSDTSRQKLVLPEGIDEYSLRLVLRKEMGVVLANEIPSITERNQNTQKGFEKNFPHLLGFFEEETVGLIDKDEALSIAQQKFFRVQKEILQCEELSDSAYDKSLELSSRTLTEYVIYREKIIKKMKEMTHGNSEAEIHNLIVPRFSEFSQDSEISDIYQNNAWLLDDKFMNFRTILSERRMDDLIGNITLDEEKVNDSGRPDIAMIFSADPSSEQFVDVVIVEIKKKTSNEKENLYAINQLMDRASKLVDFCPNIQRMWYYAVLEVEDSFAARLRQLNWTPLFSKGKTYYQEFKTERADGSIIPTPTFAVSFDAIVSDAESRNHTFLEILRKGMKEFATRQ